MTAAPSVWYPQTTTLSGVQTSSILLQFGVFGVGKPVEGFQRAAVNHSHWSGGVQAQLGVGLWFSAYVTPSV